MVDTAASRRTPAANPGTCDTADSWTLNTSGGP